MGRRGRTGFTLVELLVVIAIIVILISILMPSLSRSLEMVRQIICKSNLHQVSSAVYMFMLAHDRTLHRAPNFGHWMDAPNQPIDPNSGYAYWGVAYAPYVEGQKEIFRCPSMIKSDCDPGYSNLDLSPQVSYGLNAYVSGAAFDKIRKPSTTILAHDAFEHLLDGNGDFLSGPPNIGQWRNCPAPGMGRAVWPDNHHEHDYYRHVRFPGTVHSGRGCEGKCDILWVDGHVNDLIESDGENALGTWYTGE